MHAEAGDTLEVWLRNMLAAPVNLEPLGTAWNIQGALGPIDTGLTGRFLIDVSGGDVWKARDRRGAGSLGAVPDERR